MKKLRVVLSMFLYLLGFLLLREWLLPLEHVTDTAQTHYFIIFIAISLLMYSLNLNKWIQLGIKISVIYYCMFAIFGSDSISFLVWGKAMIFDVVTNIKLLVMGQLHLVTDLFRTFLFFILLWTITYLLQYWLILRKRILIFFLMTLVYIGALDTFTKYNGEAAMVRIVIIGFLLLSFLFFQRLLETENIKTKANLFIKWSVPLSFLLIGSVLIGYSSPKAGPIWPDPVPFVQSKADNVLPRKNQVAKIGYGNDDTKLGGPFIYDDQLVFEAEIATKQYWRVETKDVYTGKGWITSKKPKPKGEIHSGDEIPVDPISTADVAVESAEISMKLLYPHIVLPYGFVSVHGNEDGFYRYDPVLTKLLSFKADETPVKLENYEVSYKNIEYSLKALRGTTSLPDDPSYEDFHEQYTQLPEGFPERVRDLAYEITAEQDNWYDKAMAIVRYFRNDGFVYDHQKVAVPKKEQDYVDQFLFETRRGYCDNFSTSMVTLLRAVDIPARWAKGYSGGTFSKLTESNVRLYEITNNDAHSWVEVYFPTQGWVPFEPTIGFSGIATINFDEESETTAVQASADNSEKTTAPDPLEKKLADEAQEEQTNTKSRKSESEKQSGSKETSPFLIIGLSIFTIIGVSLFYKRSAWIPYILLWKYKRKREKHTFIGAYDALLRQLERLGLKRGAGETLRDYAASVDRHFGTNEMTILTEKYERAIYHRESLTDDWEYSRELWENLIKRATG